MNIPSKAPLRPKMRLGADRISFTLDTWPLLDMGHGESQEKIDFF